MEVGSGKWGKKEEGEMEGNKSDEWMDGWSPGSDWAGVVDSTSLGDKAQGAVLSSFLTPPVAWTGGGGGGGR